MKLALVSTSYPRHEGDVAGSFVEGFARTLAARGHEVEVFAAEASERVTERPAPGITVTRVPYLRPRDFQRTFYGSGVPDNLLTSARAWPGLATFPLALSATLASRSTRYDAVVSHFGVPSGLLASRWTRAPKHLAVLHSADVHLLARLPGGRALARAIVEGASALWFVSRDHHARFERTLGARIPRPVHVGPMGFDPPVDAGDRSSLRAHHGARAFLVLSVGRLVPVKGIATAIDAIARLDGAELVVAGDGPERAALESRARRLGARVRFVGSVAPGERDRWLAAADAFVLPSRVLASGRSEGMPVALLEAAHAELPIVASDVGGVSEIIAHGSTGLLVPQDDAASLARALVRVRDDVTLARRLGHAARERVRSLAWPALGETIEALLGSGHVA